MTSPHNPTMSRAELMHELAAMIATCGDGLLTAAEVEHAQVPLTQLGVTSLAHLRLIDTVEAKFGVYLNLDDGAAFLESLPALADHLITLGVAVDGA